MARRYPRDPEATTVAYTLGQAARAADVSKTTIQRAIKSGRLSASRQQDGSYVIDPSELHRAFPRDGNANGEMKQSVTVNAPGSYESRSIDGLVPLFPKDRSDGRIGKIAGKSDHS